MSHDSSWVSVVYNAYADYHIRVYNAYADYPVQYVTTSYE